jgi:hypothetical protein
VGSAATPHKYRTHQQNIADRFLIHPFTLPTNTPPTKTVISPTPGWSGQPPPTPKTLHLLSRMSFRETEAKEESQRPSS